MTRFVRVRAGLVWLLLVASWSAGVAAQASQGEIGNLMADSATLRGDLQSQAGLGVLEVTDSTGFAEDLRFTIRAESLRLEVDQQQILSAAGGLYGNNEGYNTTTRNFSEATLRSSAFRDSHYAAAIPTNDASPPTIETFADSGSLAASQETSYEVREYAFSDRAVPHSDLAGTVGVEGGLDGFDATVRGNFLVSLWEWDVEVEAANETAMFSSGRTSEPAATDPTGMSGAAAERVYQRQIYLFVTNGTLEVSGTASPESLLNLRAPELTLDGTMTLHGVAGHMADGSSLRTIRSDTLALTGTLASDIAVQGENQLRLALRGEIAQATSDGVDLAWVAPLAEPETGIFMWQWILIGLAVAAPGAFLALRTLRRRNDRRLMENLELLATHGHHDAVVRGADRLVGSRTFGRDAAILKAESLIRMGSLDEAVAFVEGLSSWEGPPAATVDYLAAEVYARKGERRKAVERLERCLRAAPEFRHEAVQNPAFSEVRETPAIARLLGESRGGSPPGGYA